ncbi:MAG: FapA family protein [Silvanigrellaceae bacterium]
MSATSNTLLSVLTLSDDKVMLVIKKGAKVPPTLAKLKHSELAETLTQMKIKAAPHKNTVTVIREAARTGSHAGDDFEVCCGEPPRKAEPGRWEWVESLRRPADHAVKDEPIIRIVPPAAPQPGVSLLGEEIAAKEEPTPEPIVLNLPPGLELQPDGRIMALASGQVKVDGQNVALELVYVIEKAHAPEYSVCEFHSNVHVLSDLIGTMKWRVFGNLEVEGHWQASDIEVFGDVQAKGGIQTNMIGTLRFWRNCQTTYIQVSQVGVLGNLTVENSVQLSELRIGGDMTCTSNPGAILGSTIQIYGGLRANKVGSENGQRTKIVLLGGDEARTTRIERLLQGTIINYRGETFTAATDTSFDSSQPPTAVVGGESETSTENAESKEA